MQRLVCFAVPLAAVLSVAAVAGFGAAWPAFSHLQHPVGLPGAIQAPHPSAFNLLAFMVPGLLAATAAIALRGRLAHASWAARIGSQALLLSALAFAAQGVFPLDLDDIDGARSRLHAAAWTAWWLGCGVAGVLMGAGLRGHAPGLRGRGLALASAAVLLLVLAGPLVIPAGLAQRIAYATWFLALWIATRPQP